jgi:hypothetical protein
MKKLIIIAIAAVFLTAGLYGQEKKEHVGLGWYTMSNDTIWTFNFMDLNLDTCRLKLINQFGTPAQNSAGTIKWINKDIPGIGKGLNLQVADGILTEYQDKATFIIFRNEKDKKNKLKNLKNKQYRDQSFIITDIEKKDVVRDIEKAKIMKHFLEQILE